MEKIRQAAKLGGADDFIEALQHKYDTHIIRPVYDYSNDEPTGDSIFVGKKTDFSKFDLNGTQKDFSGGQKQRIALWVSSTVPCAITNRSRIHEQVSLIYEISRFLPGQSWLAAV